MMPRIDSRSIFKFSVYYVMFVNTTITIGVRTTEKDNVDTTDI